MAGLKLYIVLLLLLVVGCASVTEMKKMGKFEKVSHAYELAIRWSDFEMASSFIKNQEDPDLAAQLNGFFPPRKNPIFLSLPMCNISKKTV